MTLKALRQEGTQIGSRVVPLVQAMMTLKALQEGNKANDDAVASGLSQETHKGKAKNAARRKQVEGLAELEASENASRRM